MRVVGGELGGRALRVPAGRATRPTSERVRAALFDRLGSAVLDARVLDLYAGSGALGIEALSRGARHAVFVERGGAALRVLRQNLEALGLGPRARVLGQPVAGALAVLSGARAGFDLVLVDAPYVEPASAWERAAALVAPHGWLVAERDGRAALAAPPGLDLGRRAAYGTTALEFWRREDAGGPPAGEEA